MSELSDQQKLLQKYFDRGKEMDRDRDEFEATILRVTAEVTAALTANLRDQFAMAALGSMEEFIGRMDHSIASKAYRIADAMLEARKT